jgi:hypothetical protein
MKELLDLKLNAVTVKFLSFMKIQSNKLILIS